MIPSRKSLTVVLAFMLAMSLVAAVELVARSAIVSVWLAQMPVNIVTSGAYIAKIRSFEKADGAKVMVVGDSVALGQVMEDHGVRDWRGRQLTSALSDVMRRAGKPTLVASFGGNGLRPADSARIMRDGVRAGASVVVLVANLRGFSADFEPDGQRYTYDWLAHDAPWDADQRNDGAFNAVAKVWRTRAVVDLLLDAYIGGPWRTVLSAVVRSLKPEHPVRPESDAILQMKMRQRLANLGFDVKQRFQARELARALADLSSKVPIVVVYATENPSFVNRMMLPTSREKARDSLRELVLAQGKKIQYLGPAPDMTPSHFVDQIHPNEEGYCLMAERLGAVLNRLIQ